MKSTFPAPVELRGTILGTLLYLTVYLAVMIPFQVVSKYRLLAQKKAEQKKLQSGDGKPEKISFAQVKYYNNRDVLALAGDRTVGNYIEQGFVFLPLLWMHAFFVDPSLSWRICLVYTMSRLLYPVLFLSRNRLHVLISTVPGYLVLFYLWWAIVCECYFD
jgi:MAPEG family